MKHSPARFSIFAMVLVAAGLTTGCATRNKMALEDDAEKVIEGGKPILLMSATIKNDYKSRYQPRLIVLHVEKPGATDSEGRLNFVMDDKGRDEPDDATKGNSYLMRISLEPGQYEI